MPQATDELGHFCGLNPNVKQVVNNVQIKEQKATSSNCG
jgi:hypothetical protein